MGGSVAAALDERAGVLQNLRQVSRERDSEMDNPVR